MLPYSDKADIVEPKNTANARVITPKLQRQEGRRRRRGLERPLELVVPGRVPATTAREHDGLGNGGVANQSLGVAAAKGEVQDAVVRVEGVPRSRRHADLLGQSVGLLLAGVAPLGKLGAGSGTEWEELRALRVVIDGKVAPGRGYDPGAEIARLEPAVDNLVGRRRRRGLEALASAGDASRAARGDGRRSSRGTVQVLHLGAERGLRTCTCLAR
jgi:hypothetical protein